jgi:ankyrin repeat protein
MRMRAGSLGVGLVIAALPTRVYSSNEQIQAVRAEANLHPSAAMEGESQETSVEEQLVVACQNGDADTLQRLMTSVLGLDLSLTTEDGATLITNTVIGAGTGVNPTGLYQECVQLLLETGVVDLDIVDTVYGRTAAHWAVYYKRHDLLLQLMSADANMTTPDFTGTSPFHLAISERAHLCLKQAIRNQPREILEYPDTNGNSPLERAIQMGNIEACKILVEAGASVNATDQITGQSPLHIAARNASVAIIELLLLHDAVLDLNDVEGMTPIHLASVAGSRESLAVMVKLAGDAVLSLPNAISGMTPLMYACLYGHDTLTKYFVKKKVNGGDRDVEGKTALHWAAQCTQDGGSSCVQMLLKKHKDLIEAKDTYGLTPLHCAAMAGQIDSMNNLLSAGADISAVDNDNHTVGHWATLSGQPEAVEAVLAGGGSITTPDSQGGCPLHYAAQGSNAPLPDDEGLDISCNEMFWF